MPASNAYYENYCERFENECAYSLGSNENGNRCKRKRLYVLISKDIIGINIRIFECLIA